MLTKTQQFKYNTPDMQLDHAASASYTTVQL